MIAEGIKERIMFHQGVQVLDDDSNNQSDTIIDTLGEKLDLIQQTDLGPRIGPISSQLDCINQSANVIPQPYHGRSYIGNHCNTYFNDRVYEKCTSAIVSKTQELTNNKYLIEEAKTTKQTFDITNNAFRQVHILISHCEPICENEQQFIDSSIHKYMTLYRLHFPSKVIPKQHFLEAHCVPWIARYGFGMGFHGEQGGELIHSTISFAERSGRHLRNTEKRMKTVMNKQFLMTAPELNALQPQVIKKKSLNAKKLF